MKHELLHNKIIAIIGFGRFGELLVTVLLKESSAHVLLITKKSPNLADKNLTISSEIQDIKNADIVIPCVPISEFETAIERLAKHIKPDAVVMDVCSVKMLPVESMKKHLPKSVQIIASHPMFGPDSYKIKKSLGGSVLVLHNISTQKETFQKMKHFFCELGLTVTDLTPEDHDRYMAYSLGYSYLIGKIGQKMNITQTPIDTYDFTLLLKNIEIVSSDSEQLFMDMQTMNPFTQTMRKDVMASFKKIEKQIQDKTTL